MFKKVILPHRIKADALDGTIAALLMLLPLFGIDAISDYLPEPFHRLSIVGIPVALVYVIFRDSIAKGASLGKRALRLIIVDLGTGRSCNGKHVLARNVIDIIPVINLADFVLTCIDKRGQKIMDKVLGTQVTEGTVSPVQALDVREATQGATKKRLPRVVGVGVAVVAIGIGVLFFAYQKMGLSHYNDGVHYQESGQYVLAEQQFKLALQGNPNFAEAHLNLGILYLRKGWIEGAEISTRQAIDILEREHDTWVEGATWEQTLSLAYNNLGAIELRKKAEETARFNSDRAKQHNLKAAEFFQRAIKLDPTNAQAQGNFRQIEFE